MDIREIESVYREMKRRDPDAILLIEVDRRLLTALHADAAALRRIVPGKFPYINDHDDAAIVFRAEEREPLLSLIVASGRRAAIVERVEGRPEESQPTEGGEDPDGELPEEPGMRG